MLHEPHHLYDRRIQRCGEDNYCQAPYFKIALIDEFLNADEIARGLAPKNPESVSLAASKLMLNRFHEVLADKKSFAFETTGAGLNYIRHLKKAKENGYMICLLFFWLHSPDLAIERVANRVQHGSHHIPEDTVRRRYFAGIKNLIKYYLPICDRAFILDNSAPLLYRVIATKELAGHSKIEDLKTWEQLKKVAYDHV